jgi:hypothetical protein
MLTQSELKELFNYDPLVGNFFWKKSRQGVRLNKTAGYIDGKGYRRILVDGTLYAAHHLAWLWVFGVYPKQIDHLDGDRACNSIHNLREATTSENGQNLKGPTTRNKSGFLGVYKSRGLYYAEIVVCGEKKRLGSFKTSEEASETYLAAKKMYHPFGTLGV